MSPFALVTFCSKAGLFTSWARATSVTFSGPEIDAGLVSACFVIFSNKVAGGRTEGVEGERSDGGGGIGGSTIGGS
jgi:hypothetical protein